MIKTILLVPILTLLVAACSRSPVAPPVTEAEAVAATVESAQPPYTVERRQQDFPLPVGTRRLWIDNPHGEMVLRQTPVAGSVGLRAVIQRIGEQPEEPSISFASGEGEAQIRISFESDDSHGVTGRPQGHRKGRVDLVLFVPVGLDLVLSTQDGTIEARRLDNAIDARSVSGDLSLLSSRAVSAHSDSGRLRIWALDADWDRPLSWSTISGDIAASVPSFRPLSLEVGTAGILDPQFPLDHLETQPDGSEIGHLQIQGGGLPLRVRSQTGRIYLEELKAPLPR